MKKVAFFAEANQKKVMERHECFYFDYQLITRDNPFLLSPTHIFHKIEKNGQF